MRVNQQLGEGKLREFNLGYLMELPLEGIKCICGKPLGHEVDHGICAACGLVLAMVVRRRARGIATSSGSGRATAPTT